MLSVVLRRLLAILCLASFLGGAVASSLPVAMAEPCDMTGGDMTPCAPGQAEPGLCVPLIGCALPAAALPQPPQALSFALSWTAAWYSPPPASPAGRPVEPDLLPPIARV